MRACVHGASSATTRYRVTFTNSRIYRRVTLFICAFSGSARFAAVHSRSTLDSRDAFSPTRIRRRNPTERGRIPRLTAPVPVNPHRPHRAVQNYPSI